MRQVTGSMTNVVKGMDQAMKAMDLEKVCGCWGDVVCRLDTGR